jgi:hypothetical protein
MAQASKAQIDRLGDRLRRGAVEKSDLILLDRYRRSFGAAYENVVQTIHDQLKLEPSGRRLARLRESDKVREIREEMRELRLNLADILDEEIARIENKKGEKP